MKETETERINSMAALSRYRIWNVLPEFIRNNLQNRFLIFQLVKQAYYTRYMKSLLGASWVLFAPLIGVVMWLFLHFSGILKPGETDVPYPIYVLIGSTVAGVFLDIIKNASGALISEKVILLSIGIPRETFVLSKSIVSVIDFLIAMAFNLVIMVIFGVVPAWQTIFLPIVVLPLCFLALAIGLMISLFSIISFETEKLFLIIMNAFVWLTPVVYSNRIDFELLKQVNHYNPLTYLICSPRDIILSGSLYGTGQYFLWAAVSFVFFIFVLKIFYKNERRLMEKLL